MASDHGVLARSSSGGEGMGCGFKNLGDWRRVAPDPRLRSSGVESRPMRPRQLPMLGADGPKVKTVSGARLRSGRQWSPSPVAVSGHKTPRSATDGVGTLVTFMHPAFRESAIAESACDEDEFVDPNVLGTSMHASEFDAGSSEIPRSRSRGSLEGQPLPRTLPDKLDYTHDAYRRLWSKAELFPFGGLSSKDMQAIEDLGSSGGSQIKIQTIMASSSVPSLIASRAARFEPSLDHPSRSLRDYHGNTAASVSMLHGHSSFRTGPGSRTGSRNGSRSLMPWEQLWEPSAPSSLAESKLPIGQRHRMKDKHAFIGKH